jgi:hypothetical protein
MNEIIKALFIQAGGSIEEENGNLWTYSDDLDPEKFAQLVVRECLGIVHDAERGGSNEIWDNAVKFIRRDLQEHFGVKE